MGKKQTRLKYILPRFGGIKKKLYLCRSILQTRTNYILKKLNIMNQDGGKANSRKEQIPTDGTI